MAIDKDKVFELFGRYWEAAFVEGRTGKQSPEIANDILTELRDALDADDGDVFTGQLVEIDGHAYGLRPGAARVVREALRDAECVAMLEAKLAHECAKVTNAVRLLTEIHSLLYPAHITAEDGRVWAFRPRSIDPHEVLQELSDRIRELPEKIAEMAKDGA